MRRRPPRNSRVRVRRVAIGADHGGFSLKAALIPLLQADGIEVADLGTHSAKPCDYPPIGCKVASAVAEGRFDRGILLCKSGIGIAIVANKVPGIRAAVCQDPFDAERSRRHNDANVLVMGAEKLTPAQAKRILRCWLATPFESGGRHERRVRQISTIERRLFRGQKSEDRGQKLKD
ncbi:MAG: ribose 5-phosphate isomerase B [Candidatus Omnitrophica bacterium]|nr:ribose 5-phosphate isomerase B [Candidatus Omnitrophota bacterium]